MFARLEALKVTISNFNDVKTTVERSACLEDIGELFRFLFARYSANAFTNESSQAYDNLKNALQRLGAKQQLTAKDLHGLRDFYSRLYSYDIINAIKNDFPEYVNFFEMAEKLTALELKNEVIIDGDNFIKENFDNLFNEVNTIIEDNRFISQAQDQLNDDKFNEAKSFIKNRIAEEIEKEFPGEGNYTKHFIDYYSMNPEGWSENRRTLIKRYLEIRQRVSMECKDKFDEYSNLAAEVEARATRAKNLKYSIATKISNSLIEKSGISQEQAENWANNNVYMEKGIEKKLKNIGYPKEQLLKDIADFYRYTGGKLGHVEFIMTRRTRAFAYSNKMQIAVTKYFDKRTLFHECGHLVEGLDDLSMKCSHQFIKDRATGNLQSLRSITGISGYSSSEMAYPDKFIDPYVGKVYQWPASEVYSMAIENMSSPERIINFLQNDPEHFKLFLGVCLHKDQELAKRIKQIADTAAQRYNNNIDKEKKEKIWQSIISKSIKNIELPLEKLLTSSTPYEGFKLWVRGNKCYLMWQIDDRTSASVYSGTKKNAIAAAYFALLSKHGQIPLEFQPEQYSFKNNITEYVDGSTPPSWYDAEKGLPVLELGDKGATITDLYNAWMNELKKRTPQNMLDLLKQEGGFCDYFINRIPDSANKKIYLYHNEATWKWIARERPSLIVHIAYLLIAFDKGLLPDYKSSYRSIAASTFEHWLTKKIVPDWFDPEKGLPELPI